jgi:hypothetical protein
MTPPFSRSADRPDPPRLAVRLAQRAAGDAWGDAAAGAVAVVASVISARQASGRADHCAQK